MNILVVDDDQMTLEVVGAALRQVGHQVTLCVSRDTAVPALEEKGAKFDLMITDIIMPGWDGIKLSKYVKQYYPEMPIVGMTTGVENAVDDYVNMAEMFMDETLAKPFEAQAMVDVVERLGKAA